MTLPAPLFLQNDTYDADQFRQLLDIVVADGGVALVSDLEVTQRAAGANRSVDVAPGTCVIPGTDIADQGKYLCRLFNSVNVPLDAAPGTGQSRIDLIIAQARDSTAVFGAPDDWTITFVKGTAASSPTVPSAPASSIVLAQVLVGSNVTTITDSNITDTRAAATGALGLARPTARMYLATADTPLYINPSNTPGQISPLTKDFANGITFASSAFTIVTPGLYRVTAQLEQSTTTFGSSSTAHAGVEVHVNGTAVRLTTVDMVGLWAAPLVNDLIVLDVGDVVTLYSRTFYSPGGVAIPPANTGVSAQDLSTFLALELVSN
jgi:hypothetical protein